MPPAGKQQPPPATWVNGYPVAEGTPLGLALRAAQVVCAAAALVFTATSVAEVPRPYVTKAFGVAAGTQCLWSLTLVALNIYDLRVKRGLQSRKALFLLVSGDVIFGVLINFGAICASAGITIVLDNDMKLCSAEFECGRSEAAIAMGFMSWCFGAPLLFLNSWALRPGSPRRGKKCIRTISITYLCLHCANSVLHPHLHLVMTPNSVLHRHLHLVMTPV